MYVKNVLITHYGVKLSYYLYKHADTNTHTHTNVRTHTHARASLDLRDFFLFVDQKAEYNFRGRDII